MPQLRSYCWGLRTFALKCETFRKAFDAKPATALKQCSEVEIQSCELVLKEKCKYFPCCSGEELLFLGLVKLHPVKAQCFLFWQAHAAYLLGSGSQMAQCCRPKSRCFRWEMQLRKQYVQPLHARTTCSTQAVLPGPRTALPCRLRGSFRPCHLLMLPKHLCFVLVILVFKSEGFILPWFWGWGPGLFSSCGCSACFAARVLCLELALISKYSFQFALCPFWNVL